MPEDYLVHHGILGQKWGIRRFQNKDGTLTSAGKVRRRQEVSETEIPAWKAKVSRRPEVSETELVDRYSSDYDDFRDTAEFRAVIPKAYSATLEWYRKNEPYELEYMTAESNGRTYDLLVFHDFRKMFEGYEDEYTITAWHEYLEKVHPNYMDEIRAEKLEHKQNNQYLAHHGILGMKWGIRRFQNKDGSYTNAGKLRRQQADDAADSAEPKSSPESSSEPQQTARVQPSSEPIVESQREGMSPEQRRALLLAGAGAVAAATIIGVSIYNEKHGGAKEAGKEFVDGLKDVKIPKIDVADDATAAKDAADAVLKSRAAEKALATYVAAGGNDRAVFDKLADTVREAQKEAKMQTERRENVANFVKNNKDTILSDPALVKKYSAFLGEKDVASVANKMTNLNKVNAARIKQAKEGAEWLGVVTATGTAIKSTASLFTKKGQNKQQNQTQVQKEKEQ